MARKKQYDAKALFMEGLMAFGSFFSGRMGLVKTYTADETRRRNKSHAKFKAQCAARREQRRLEKLSF